MLLIDKIRELGTKIEAGHAQSQVEMLDLVGNVIQTTLEGWRALRYNGTGLIYDLGIDDILVAPVSGDIIFIDADGGKRCGGLKQLICELDQLKEAVKFYCEEYTSTGLLDRILKLFPEPFQL